MSAEEWRFLVDRVLKDVRSSLSDRILAENLARRTEESGSSAETMPILQEMLREIEQRGHRPTSSSGSRTRPATLAWDRLIQELITAEQKWGRVANAQFWLGILTVPLVLIAAGLLALQSIEMDPGEGVFLALIVGAAVTHSFLVLRIHQQARQAEERIVEKRVGLAFLQVAIEDYVGAPGFQSMIQAGTQMFLGHHAAPTVPLNSEDLRVAMSTGTKDPK